MTVFKCIHSLASLYLANDCVLASSVAGRRSAICPHKDTGASPDKNCHWYQRVCGFRCCRMEQLTRGTSNAVLLSTNFCAKTKETQTPVYRLLRAYLRIFFYFALYKCVAVKYYVSYSY